MSYLYGNPDDYERVNVSGQITQISYGKGGKSSTFTLWLSKSKQTIKGVFDFYCQLKEKDIISGPAIRTKDGNIMLVSIPFVQPPTDVNYIIDYIMKTVRCGARTARECIIMLRGPEGDMDPCERLTDMAQRYSDTKDSDIPRNFVELDMKKASKLLYCWHKDCNLRRLYLFGLKDDEINKCRMTCQKIYEHIMEDVYKLPGIALEKADSINRILGIACDPMKRYKGSIIRLIWDRLWGCSWVGTPLYHIKKTFPMLDDVIQELIDDYDIKVYKGNAFLSFPYKATMTVANKFIDLISKNKFHYDTVIDEKEFMTIKSDTIPGKELSSEQIKAVQGALEHTLCCISGGAGVGKTTVLRCIIDNLRLRNLDYIVASFKGKAVSRIKEVTGEMNAATMHMLIANAHIRDDKPQYTVWENPHGMEKSKKVLVIDEAGTVTTELMYDFLQAYPGIEKIILIGDVNQLPPIGWGSMYLELLKAQICPVYYLTKNFRVYTVEGQVDSVIYNANAMIKYDDEFPFEFTPGANFNIYEGPVDHVYTMAQLFAESNIRQDQFVILSPYKRCLPDINKKVQDLYQGSKQFVVDSRRNKWVVGDRVVMLHNNKEIGVSNGDCGTITSIDPKEIYVDFGVYGTFSFLIEPKVNPAGYGVSKYRNFGRTAESVGKKEDEAKEKSVLDLSLAYAMTIDKSQGSEWDFVIFYVDDLSSGGNFLCCERIYTAITRTKRCCWVVSPSNQALGFACMKRVSWRCDSMATYLKEKLEGYPPYKELRQEMNPELDYYMDDDIPSYDEDE